MAAGNAVPNSSSSSSVPPVPGWDTSRPYLTGQFILEVSAKQAAGRVSAEVLESYPPSLQETLCKLASKLCVLQLVNVQGRGL